MQITFVIMGFEAVKECHCAHTLFEEVHQALAIQSRFEADLHKNGYWHARLEDGTELEMQHKIGDLILEKDMKIYLSRAITHTDYVKLYTKHTEPMDEKTLEKIKELVRSTPLNEWKIIPNKNEEKLTQIYTEAFQMVNQWKAYLTIDGFNYTPFWDQLNKLLKSILGEAQFNEFWSAKP
jgi:Txe/YoeB family toxin of Txe-Axe toxin-antitoxin module